LTYCAKKNLPLYYRKPTNPNHAGCFQADPVAS